MVNIKLLDSHMIQLRLIGRQIMVDPITIHDPRLLSLVYPTVALYCRTPFPFLAHYPMSYTSFLYNEETSISLVSHVSIKTHGTNNIGSNYTFLTRRENSLFSNEEASIRFLATFQYIRRI